MSDTLPTPPTPAELHAAIVAHFEAHPKGKVQITTYTRSTLYKSADWFRVAGGSLYVRSGKRWNIIATSTGPLVSIRVYA